MHSMLSSGTRDMFQSLSISECSVETVHMQVLSLSIFGLIRLISEEVIIQVQLLK